MEAKETVNDPKEHPENKHIVDICIPVKPSQLLPRECKRNSTHSYSKNILMTCTYYINICRYLSLRRSSNRQE